MNPDDDVPEPYVPPMHLGKIVGSAASANEASHPVDSKRLAEIERRIAELEAEALNVGVSGKLRIEQSLEELRREREEILGQSSASGEDE